MKVYKDWLLDQIIYYKKCLSHAQHDLNQILNQNEFNYQKALNSYHLAFDEFKNQGLSDEDADSESRAVFDSWLDNYIEDTQRYYDTIDYYIYMIESFETCYQEIEKNA